MFTINTATISGTLGKDPERIASDKGCKFSLAVNERIKKGDNWEDYTSWIDVVAWGSLSDQIVKQLSKGSRIALTGRLRQDKWQSKEGENRSKVGLIAESFFFPKNDGNGNGGRFNPETDVPADTAGLGSSSGSAPDADIPFA